MGTLTDFVKAHAYMVFNGALVALALVMVVASMYLTQEHLFPFAANLLEHLAAILIATAAATTILAFRDVRESLAAAISALLLKGEVVAHLSPASRKTLKRALLKEDTAGRVADVTIPLVETLDAVALLALSRPHFADYNLTITITRDPTRPGTLKRCMRCDYTISARHLEGGRAAFHILMQQELSDPNGSMVEPVLHFLMRIGDKRLTRDDLKITKSVSGGLPVYRIELDVEVPIVGEVRVWLEQDTLASEADKSEILYIRYPTRGYHARLFFEEGMIYDAAWFQPVMDVSWRMPGRDDPVMHANGIEATTNDWLLPGHGVILYWFPAPEKKLLPPAKQSDAPGSEVAQPPV